MDQAYILFVKGMHCKACELLIESELSDLKDVSSVRSSLSHSSVEIIGDFQGRTSEQLAREFSTLLERHGYSLSVERTDNATQWDEFNIAIPIALGFLSLFLLLQRLHLLNFVGKGDLSYGTVCLIGVVASFSSCMATVGGIALSLSASFAKMGSKKWPQILFHLGRLISFFFLGGLIGALGSAFTLTPSITFVLDLIISLSLLGLGLSLLDVFPWMKKLQLTMPKALSGQAFSISRLSNSFAPFLVGVVTFFLPCGFTQSMQLYSLSTGSFAKGALTMFAFAVGTFPILAAISFFGSASVVGREKSGIFFKASGLLMIAFAFYNTWSAFALLGVLPPAPNL
jgi:sulfite exporter TauE/SafE/copper chaperone CopZ